MEAGTALICMEARNSVSRSSLAQDLALALWFPHWRDASVGGAALCDASDSRVVWYGKKLPTAWTAVSVSTTAITGDNQEDGMYDARLY